ncbi:MAG: hypothetical protein ACKO6N_24880 [Myxococcota bacterium]
MAETRILDTYFSTSRPGTSTLARTASGSTVLDKVTPSRLFSPDGLSISGTGQSATALQLSQYDRFVQINADLLTLVDSTPALLDKALTQGFEDRTDLLTLVSEYVGQQLPDDSPLTTRFLSENVELTALLAFNLGGLREKVSQDASLAASLADGQTIQTQRLTELATVAAALTQDRGGLTASYFEENPLAAAYLLNNSVDARRIGADRSGESAEAFKRKLALSRDLVRDGVAEKAASLLNNPTAYPLSYLKTDEKFTALLVGSAALEDSRELPIFLRNNPQLTLERVDVSELLRAYESDKAVELLSSTGPLTRDFLSRNVGLALVINRDESTRKAILDDLPRLQRFEQGLSQKAQFTHEAELFQAYQKTTQKGELSFYY